MAFISSCVANASSKRLGKDYIQKYVNKIMVFKPLGAFLNTKENIYFLFCLLKIPNLGLFAHCWGGGEGGYNDFDFD